jgi:truncated hemoglobin YjbI
MYKYQGDRHQEQYDQTEKTEEQFTKALFHYTEALKRVASNKARAVLCGDVAYVTSLLTSQEKEKLVAYYKLGFDHAHEGLQIIRKMNVAGADAVREVYPYEPDTAELAAKLQKSYGSNLTGLSYVYYLRKDYKGIMAMRPYLFDAGFDWENKDVTFTLMAETADKLASEHHRQPQLFKTYKEICLTASSRAFKLVMKKYGGKAPEYTPEFCRAYQYYVNYLGRFGETIEARNLSLQYEPGCQNVAPPAQ